MRARTAVLAAALVAALSLVAGATAAAAHDYAIIARDVVPSGQPGSVPVPAGADSQAKMYDALTPLFNHVTDQQLPQFFKPETLGTATPRPLTTETVPRQGLTLVRDGYDVPHIHGVTRDDVTWGAGWVLAEDRGLLLGQAGYDALVAAIDAPGLSALGLVSSLQNFSPSAQTVHEVAKQTGALMAAGAKGRAVPHDIDVYLQGINAYLPPTVPRRPHTRAPTSTPSTRSRISSWGRAVVMRRFAPSSCPRCSAASEPGAARRSGPICARPTTPRLRPACPATCNSRRPRAALTATWSLTATA